MSDSLPAQNSDATPLVTQYFELIDQIVETTLKGKIRSKEQVYQMLIQGVRSGTGEVFERCLSDRLQVNQTQVKTQTDEFKLAKATRISRALQTIQGEWERWQEQNQVQESQSNIVRQILQSEPDQRLSLLLQAIDPNHPQAIGPTQWKKLAKTLETAGSSDDLHLQDLAAGLTRGVESWQHLADHLVSWIYEQSQGQLGFEGVPGQAGPWAVWGRQVGSSPLRGFFETVSLNQSVPEWVSRQADLDLATWLELALVLQCLQQGLVTWFDKLVYDVKVGAKLSISTYLTFAVLWSQIASGFGRVSGARGTSLANGAFQITLQILRHFAQREYFPLYGGIFASFSGNYLRDALSYLDEPLRRTEGTQEKARILVLLGYSLGVQGQYDQANTFYQQALEISRTAGDRACEIASLNHLSRTCITQKLYSEAIQSSQRALILSRQGGDRLGEANALANLGYSEVFQAQQLEQADPDVYESAIRYLEQGLTLSERLGDRQSQALCLSSLGLAELTLDEYGEAIAHLEGAIQSAQISGDLYLYGINLAYLAEAHYRQDNPEQAVYYASLGMYLLEQIGSTGWRQAAGLLAILQGQLGEETFQTTLAHHRARIIAAIGVDGYDYVPQLLQQYRHPG